MNQVKIKFLSFVLLLFSQTLLGSDYTQKQLCKELEIIEHAFEVKYAPLFLKKKLFSLDLEQTFFEAKQQALATPDLSVYEAQKILLGVFNQFKDYHVNIRFYSTERASLPFKVRSAEGRYFVVESDTHFLKKGDEILYFDGVPIQSILDEIRFQCLGDNTQLTDEMLSQVYLTKRVGSLGCEVPSGEVLIGAKDSRSGAFFTAILEWDYTEEKIPDPNKKVKKPQITCGLMKPKSSKKSLDKGWNKEMSSLFGKELFEVSRLENSLYSMGSKTSYVPKLGKVIWSNKGPCFEAYIFKHPGNYNVGYLRIPHYYGDDYDLDELDVIIKKMERKTIALVIDQVNNPGGDLFYLYSIASRFATRPLETPYHKMALTQEEVSVAVSILDFLEEEDLEDIIEYFSLITSRTNVDERLIANMKLYCQFIIDQWNQGKKVTDPYFLFGIDEIYPQTQEVYTKPVVVLTNPLDFSGGDFFPAILQDNKRARIIGQQTAGAGGYVSSFSTPNCLGINYYCITGSVATRLDDSFLENKGVVPDAVYEFKVEDLINEYESYKEFILNEVNNLL